MQENDLGGPLSGFSHGRSYSNKLASRYEGPNGNNWLIPNWPYLVQDGGDIVYVKGQQRVWFDSSLVAKFGADVAYTLNHDSGADVYTLTVVTQVGIETTMFHGFTQSTKPKGFLKEHTDAYGKTTTAHSYKGESIEELRRTESGTLWSIVYTFYGTGSFTDRIQYATLRKSTNSGSNWTDIRRVHYSYHTGDTSYGSRNDLETVTDQWLDGSTWKDASKTYYRWYKAGDTNGFEGGLKYVLGPAAYAEMLADNKTPESTQDIAGYADHYFEYDSTTREVTKEIATSCAGCGGGGGTGSNGESFTRTSSSHADGYNNWKWKVVVTKSNGNVETVYTNYLGQVMLKELKESASSTRKWVTYTKYGTTGGAAGKEIEKATPAAVTSYNDSNADLGVSLKTDAGLITYNTYGDSTTADGETLGDGKGYPKLVEISEGTAGDKIKQRKIEYKTSTNTTGEKTIVPGKVTAYRTDAGAVGDEIATTYAYKWHTGGSVPGAAMEQQTTTLPAVPTDQNGVNATADVRVYFDANGRKTFTQDAKGIVTKNTYDGATGKMIKQQVDVPSNEPGLPSDWTVGGSTPHGNATTDYEYDDWGRRVQSLGPKHKADLGGSNGEEVRHATWTVYIEAVTGNQTWTGKGYQKDSDSSFELVSPVAIRFSDKNGKPVDQIRSARSTGSGKLSSSDTFLREGWTSWTTRVYSTAGELEYQRTYHTIPSSNSGLDGVDTDPGTQGANYEETHYGYDKAAGLLVRTLSPGGTITRQVYDAVNRASSTWIGTDDGGANWETWDPASPGTNMKKVSQTQYDGGASGGNSLVTRETEYVDGNTTRETDFTHDFRSRVLTISGEESSFTQLTYNNLNQTTKTEQYDGSASGNLLSREESFFDERGQEYRTKTYEVDPDTGSVGNHLTGDTWRDQTGRVTESINPGSGEVFTKTEYDNVGRTTRVYVGYDDGGSDYIVTDRKTHYNVAGQTLYSESLQRDTDTPGSTPTFRTTYSAAWYEGSGRMVATASYGTNNGASFSRPETVPPRSDDVLVRSRTYNTAGLVEDTTDPKGTTNRVEYDAMSRPTKRINNYQSSGSGSDVNQATSYTYTADSALETQTAEMDSPTPNQTTTYVYGVTTASGSDLNANNLLTAIQYPEDSATKRIDLKVNRLGQIIEREDQAGTVHQYAYDGRGRSTTDKVTAFGDNIDQSVKRMVTTYATRGWTDTITSYSEIADATPGNQVVNQVQYERNGFGQLTSDWQEHDGSVVTSGAGLSKRVQYGFAPGNSGAMQTNQARRESITYPSGRQIGYNYGPASGENDHLNRIHAIKDGSTALAEYKYLGGARVVLTDYTEPDIKLDLWGGTAGSYDGLDNFGRVKDQHWINYSGTPVDVSRFKYGYDRDGLPEYQRDTVAHALAKGFDGLFSRDSLGQINDYQRGLLNDDNDAIPANDLDFQQSWNLDKVGNWDGFDQDSTGNGTNDLEQTRDHDKANEITDITNTTGSPWIEPVYDDAGNTTTMPKPEDPTKGFTATYDAWNRLVSLSDKTTGTKVAEYVYDPRGFRVRKTQHGVTGLVEKTIDYYYSKRWQCVEQIEVSSGGSSSSSSFSFSSSSTTTSTIQYVWGLRYVDDLICRDIGSQRLYALSDRFYSVAAIVDANGNVKERYAYPPYGEVEFLDKDYNARSSSSYAWERLFQGLSRDSESGLYDNRRRIMHPVLGRFLQRDPLGYPDGMNAYAAYHCMLSRLDPYGTATEEECEDLLNQIEQNRQEAQSILNQIQEEHGQIREEIDRLRVEEAFQEMNDRRHQRRIDGADEYFRALEEEGLTPGDLGFPDEPLPTREDIEEYFGPPEDFSETIEQRQEELSDLDEEAQMYVDYLAELDEIEAQVREACKPSGTDQAMCFLLPCLAGTAVGTPGIPDEVLVAAAIAVVLLYAACQQTETLPLPRVEPIPLRPQNRRSYICEAYGHLVSHETGNSTAFGPATGIGNSKPAACAVARSNLANATPEGHHLRHASTDCRGYRDCRRA